MTRLQLIVGIGHINTETESCHWCVHLVTTGNGKHPVRAKLVAMATGLLPGYGKTTAKPY